MLPMVAILGRPNVGKSTLFNRLLGKKWAIESPIPGTTRDRLYGEYKLGHFLVLLIDMAGLDFQKTTIDLENDVQLQAKIALQEANLVFFVVDGNQELTSADFMVADILRKSKKPAILIVNKCENVTNFDERSLKFYELGFANQVQVSALHGFGLEELAARADKLLKNEGLKPIKKPDINENYINLAFLGRPNVGKSSLVNALLQENRLVVSDTPGTTRDAVDIQFNYKDKIFNFIDTAGLRRRGKVEKDLEYFSVVRSFQAIDRSDVGLLLIDAEEGVTNQDCHVAQYILEKHKGLIIVINKSDLMTSDEKTRDHFLLHIKSRLVFVPWASVIFVSALNRKNVYRILDIAKEIKEERKKRIPTSAFNAFVEAVIERHPPTLAGSRTKKPRIYYGTQVGIEPPQFVFFVNDKTYFHFSYKRYLENEIRKEYGFLGTSLRIDFKNRRAD